MNKYKDILIDSFTYDLPSEKIAKFPLDKRDESKLLVYKNKTVSQDHFKNIDNYLKENSLLVFNNTKVIQARLIFHKETGARIEIFCLEPLDPSDFSLAFQKTKKCKWKCIVGNLKKWKDKNLSRTFQFNEKEYILTANKIDSNNSSQEIEFSWNNKELTFSDVLEAIGEIPIPPYLNRESEESDKKQYQTIYSKHNGSVAAPTAGLHFTNDVFDKLKKKNIDFAELTLHVGAGTFKPVKSQTIGEHEMHTEHIFINIDTLQQLINNIGKITVVGTTSVRTLESLYWLGVKILEPNNIEPEDLKITQWEVYDLNQNISTLDALKAVHKYMIDKERITLSSTTQIIIVPGYKFRVINYLITNFHQPQSTLLLLISAFVGDDWKKIYDYALNNNFRFLSYGDSCLLIND
ncbi:MAG: S-adenosylmethionine:tRNA ribosyltransferase-isomerase [Bacteroidetes bacterium]|nr:S-adenosylmethionine:tRNA ribosyltransferase-isomerase [Bacteroidota bacterium]